MNNRKFKQNIRTYKMHGQTTTVTRCFMYDKFIIDCGGFWMCHHIRRSEYMGCIIRTHEYNQGSYDTNGFFETFYNSSREEFIQGMKQALRYLKRIYKK